MKYFPKFGLLMTALTMTIIGGAGLNLMGDGREVSPQIDDDKAMITRLEHEWLEAIKAHNFAWFERNFASDCTEVNSGDGAIKTKAQDIADFKADKTVFETLEFEDLKVRVEGNAAVANGITHIIAHDDKGQKFDVRLRFTDTWIKRDGRWQVWAAQHTRVRP